MLSVFALWKFSKKLADSRMNNNSVSVPIRKATTAEFIDMNKSAHLMRKAMMPTVEKEEPSEEKEAVAPKSKVKARRAKPVMESVKELPKVSKVSDFVNQHLA